MNFSAIDFAAICSRNPAKIARFAVFCSVFRAFSALFTQNVCFQRKYSHISRLFGKNHTKFAKPQKMRSFTNIFFKAVANTLDYAKNLLIFVNFSAIDFAVICSRNPAKIARFAVFCSNFRSFFGIIHAKRSFSAKYSHISRLFCKNHTKNS